MAAAMDSAVALEEGTMIDVESVKEVLDQVMASIDLRSPVQSVIPRSLLHSPLPKAAEHLLQDVMVNSIIDFMSICIDACHSHVNGLN